MQTIEEKAQGNRLWPYALNHPVNGDSIATRADTAANAASTDSTHAFVLVFGCTEHQVHMVLISPSVPASAAKRLVTDEIFLKPASG